MNNTVVIQLGKDTIMSHVSFNSYPLINHGAVCKHVTELGRISCVLLFGINKKYKLVKVFGTKCVCVGWCKLLLCVFCQIGTATNFF